MAQKQSNELYKKLLTFSIDIRDVFLKNVPKFENQLKFDEFNELCYKKMYENVLNTSQIKKTQELYEEIPGLKEIYQKARKFFLTPRNKSIKGLDVQFGNKLDDALISFLKSQNINASRADLQNKKLPDIMILDKSKNILAYIEHKYHNAPFMLSWRLTGREPYEGSITMDTEKLKKQLIEIESELERPVFFVHWIDFPDLKGVFFNTNEQIKEYLLKDPKQFERKERIGDFKGYEIIKKVGYTEKFYPPLHEMGDLEELISLLKK